MDFPNWYVQAMREWERRSYGYVSDPDQRLNEVWRTMHRMGYAPEIAAFIFYCMATHQIGFPTVFERRTID